MNNTTTKLMFSSKSNDWATPQHFFDKLDRMYGPFTLAAAASEDNYKVKNHFTMSDNALDKDWSGNTVFVNPPYGRALKNWIRKAYEEGQKENTTVVMLIPSRTDTAYWHDYVMKSDEISFVKGRIKFGDESNSAPFPSAVVVFRKTHHSGPRIGVIERT